MPRWPNVVSYVALLALVALGPAAAADQADGKAQARRLVDEGSGAYERGDFAAALVGFERAFAAYPSPKLWFNIGQAQRALGRPVEAAQAFRRFLAEAQDATPDTRADAQVLLAGLERNLGRVRVVCDTDGADVLLDGMRVGVAPVSQLLWATAGRHTVTAVASGGRSAEAPFEIQPGTIRSIQLSFAAESATVAPVAEVARARDHAPGGWWLGRTWTWVAAGSAVLLAGGAATSGLLMQAKYDELDQSCGNASPARQGCDPSELDALSLRRDVANGLWIAAGAAALTAGVLFFVEGHSVAVAPMAGPTAGLQGRFSF